MGRAPRAGAALLVVLLTAAVVVQGPVAQAAEATTPRASVTFPMRTTDWGDTAVLPRFDPALGELREVHLEIDGRMEGTIAMENVGPTPLTGVLGRATATMTVSRPGAFGGSLLTASGGGTRTRDLDGFDGTLDHAGPSGDTHGVSANIAATVTLTDPTDLALFTGVVPISLPTAGTDASADPTEPAVSATITTRVGGTVSVTYTYVSDTRPPDPPTIVTSPSAYTADPDPLITFTHEAGATAECQLTTPVSTGPWAACTSPWQGHLGATGDGAYSFAVRATDGAGNVGTPATRSFTLDRQAPASPTLSFSLLGPLPVLARWSFGIEPGATARCSLDGSAAAPCTSPFSVDIATLLDGDHTFSVFAVDAAGNTGPAASHTYTLDRVPPGAPTITGTPATPGNDPTPTWTFDLAPDAATATCSVDGAAPVSCTSPFTANLSTATDGSHTLTVRNADAAGNLSAPASSTYVLDRVLPGTPIVTAPPSPSNDTTPEWTIAAEPGATTSCRLDDGPWTPCGGTFAATFGPGSDGVHVLSVRATDQAGNVGPETTSAFTLDTTPPPAPTFLATPPDPSNSPTPSWTFSVEAGSQAACSLDGGAWTACASPYVADLGAAADGVHTLAVRATDAYGNTGPSASAGFLLDRAAPTAPTITTSPASPGADPVATFAFTTPAGTHTRCRVDTAPMFDCVDEVTVTLTSDGVHRFAVIAVDDAGNPSAAAEALYTLDRVAPAAPTITDAPASPSRVSTPRWTFAIEEGSTGECRLDGGPWTPCTATFSADLSAAGDGLHTIAIRATDLAGNVGEPTTASYVLDRTPPPAPVITSGPDPYTRDDTPTWTFTVDDGNAQCRIDDGPWVPCDGSTSADLRAAPDGAHSLEVRAVDAVGNEGPTTVAVFELDRTAAAAAVFTTTPSSPGHDPTPEWAFSHEPGTTAWCSLDGGPAAPCAGTFAAELSADGEHHLTVTVVDAAGNTSDAATATYLLDTVAPAAPVVTSPGSPGRDDTPEWLIEVEPDAVAECSLDGAAPVACATLFEADLRGRDGPHELVVTAYDPAGNASEPTVSTYVLDSVAPVAPVLLHTPDAASWTWRFAIEPGASAECSIDGGPWTPCASPMPGGTPDRKVRFEVRAVDRAGNRSPVTGTTVTPTRGTATPPSPPPAPSDPGPAPSRGGPRPAAAPAVPETPFTPAVRAPGVTLDRDLADAEVDGTTILRPMREEGLFAGPVRDLLQAAAERSTIPVLVVMVVLAFVAVQNRIDRMDPKLADAPVRHEPEYLEFE